MANIPDTDPRDPLARTFSTDWWAAQPAEVQAINPNTASHSGAAFGQPGAAFALASRGVPVDVEIVVWGTDPWLAHAMRTSYGIPFVGSMEGVGPRGALDPPKPMNIPVDQWAAMVKANPGCLPTVYFDPSDPDGTLRRLHALYPPPAPAPKPAPVVAGTNLVGAWLGGSYYAAGPGATSETVKDGNVYLQDGRSFVAHVAGSQSMDVQAHTFTAWFTLK